jgi:hypothetical protein
MSHAFESGQYNDFNQAQSDRLQQFGSPENGNKLLVDMASPTEARLAGQFSQAFGQNGEQTLPQTSQLTFDDPYASTIGSGSWRAQSWSDSFGQDVATGGAAHSFPGELQIKQQVGKIEQDLLNLVSLLERCAADEAAYNATTTPQGDTQPANIASNGGSETPNTPQIDIPPTNTASSGATNDAVTPTPADNPPTNSASNATNNDTGTSTQGAATGGTAGDGSGFKVNNGKLTYNGETLAGVNVTSEYAQNVGAQTLANEISSDFPGINVVRLMTSPDGGAYSEGGQKQGGQSTSDIQADIKAFNAKGIGVIIDNHNSDANTANNVSQDGNEAQWFGTLAQQNLGNNGVMFQTENEPTGSNQDIVNEQVAAYNAIRATGSNNLVAFDLAGGYSASPQLSDPSAYDSMSNYVIDAHAYVSDSNPVPSMQYEAAQTASLTEANGQAVPVYFGETGNSIDGSNIASAANQLLQAEFTDGKGAVAFAFDHAAFGLDGGNQADNMTDANGNLNGYGQYIASLIQQSSSSASG